MHICMYITPHSSMILAFRFELEAWWCDVILLSQFLRNMQTHWCETNLCYAFLSQWMRKRFKWSWNHWKQVNWKICSPQSIYKHISSAWLSSILKMLLDACRSIHFIFYEFDTLCERKIETYALFMVNYNTILLWSFEKKIWVADCVLGDNVWWCVIYEKMRRANLIPMWFVATTNLFHIQLNKNMFCLCSWSD